MIYSSVDRLLEKISEGELINLVNDENRAIEEIDISEEYNSDLLPQDQDVCYKRVHSALVEVSALIDTSICNRYDVKNITTYDAVLGAICDALVKQKLYHKRRITDEAVNLEAKNARDDLKQIQMGQKHLSLPLLKSETGKSSFIKTNKTAADRKFSKDVMRKF